MPSSRSEQRAPTQRPAVRPDLLSDVLDALRVEESLFCMFEFGDPWGVELEHMPLAMTWTVIEGTVWLLSPDSEPIAFHPGDTFLLPRGIVEKPYVFASSPDIEPRCAQDLWREAELQGFELGSHSGRRHHVRWGGPGKPTRVISTAFGYGDRGMSPLVSVLPELLFARASEKRGALADVMFRLVLAGESDVQPGLAALVRQIAQTLSVLVVRTHALSSDNRASGWLAGLGDSHISRALASIHREPGHDWTLTALARSAGLSRSLFAERFLARVGQTPKRYLRSWRMHLAREALAGGNVGVAALAHKLGYQSEAAFRKAFQDATGRPPLQFRRRAVAESVPQVAKDTEQFFGLYARLGGAQNLRDLATSDATGHRPQPFPTGDGATPPPLTFAVNAEA